MVASISSADESFNRKWSACLKRLRVTFWAKWSLLCSALRTHSGAVTSRESESESRPVCHWGFQKKKKKTQDVLARKQKRSTPMAVETRAAHFHHFLMATICFTATPVAPLGSAWHTAGKKSGKWSNFNEHAKDCETGESYAAGRTGWAECVRGWGGGGVLDWREEEEQLNRSRVESEERKRTNAAKTRLGRVRSGDVSSTG